jgi:hypothetical protein
MPISKTEVNKVAKFLETADQEMDSVEMAESIIGMINELREKKAQWATVCRLTIRETDEWEESKGLFIVGPFSSRLQATRAGEGLAWSNQYWSSSGEWNCAPIVSSARSAWDAIHPEKKDKFGWIRDSIKEREIAMHGEEWFREKRGW